MLAFESRLVKLEAALDRASEEINRANRVERRIDALLARLCMRHRLLQLEGSAPRCVPAHASANDNLWQGTTCDSAGR
jgi:hypothetical protein